MEKFSSGQRKCEEIADHLVFCKKRGSLLNKLCLKKMLKKNPLHRKEQNQKKQAIGTPQPEGTEGMGVYQSLVKSEQKKWSQLTEQGIEIHILTSLLPKDTLLPVHLHPDPQGGHRTRSCHGR